MAPKAAAPRATPPGMITVYINATPLFARRSAIEELGLEPVADGRRTVYLFPQQQQHFAQARAANPGVSFGDYLVAGFGTGIGFAVADNLVDAIFSGGKAVKKAAKK